MKKTLRLRSESLAALTSADLEAVAGGAVATYECSFPKCPTLDFCELPVTLPVRECLKQ